MYKFTANNQIVGYASEPNYIKLLDNGSYGLCGAEDAQGIAVNSTPYQLDGKTLDGCATITMEYLEDGTYFAQMMAAEQERNIYEEALTALGALPLDEEVTGDDTGAVS